MSEEKKHRIFTAADIEKYHKGLLSPIEMHELEKAALDDPFLADALEGYGSTTTDVSSDLSELEKKLKERVGGAKVISLEPRPRQFKWWRIAAAVVLVGGLGFATFKLLSNRNEKPLANSEKKNVIPPVSGIVDSNKSAFTDSTAVAAANSGSDTRASESLGKKAAVKPEKKTRTDQFEATAGVASFKYSRKKTDSLDDKKNEESVAIPRAQAKRAEITDVQKGIVSGKESVSIDQERINNYFKGRVLDRNNNPLPFANITNTQDNVGTYADAQGNFTLISSDTVLNVQVKSVGFENNFAQLKNNVASNSIVMQDDKKAPDKIISLRKAAANPSPMANMKLEELEPADGWVNYNTYLANNINVPDDLKMKGDKGQVLLSFDVNQNGQPVDIKVEKSLCQKCDDEAVRLIKQGPKWRKNTRKPGRVTVTVPFDSTQ